MQAREAYNFSRWAFVATAAARLEASQPEAFAELYGTLCAQEHYNRRFPGVIEKKKDWTVYNYDEHAYL